MKRLVADRLAKLCKDRSGGVFVYTAVILPVLLGISGISVDIGVWYANSRLAQTAADSGAIAGALEVMRSNGASAAITAAVNTDTANNGFTHNVNGDQVTVNNPPTSGAFAGNTDAVEVIVSRPGQSLLGQFVFQGATTITARAVARAALMDVCVWSLNPTAQSAIKVSGGAQVNLGCGVLSNSNDPNGLTQSGSSCLNATRVLVVGGASGSCINPGPLGGVSPIADPLSAVTAPSYDVDGDSDEDTDDCDFPGNITVGPGPPVTLTPGTYCGSIRVVGSGTLNFDPGLYVLNGAGLDIGAQGTVTGTDVSFYLTEYSGTSDNITIAAGADVTLSAPSGGPLPGILFYHDRNSPPNVTHNLTGGANMHLEGILYFPNQTAKFSGGTSLDSSTSLIIADTVIFTGNTEIGGFENSPALFNPLLITATLVE
ncbi:MAG: pilus assembly protein TadG-related protein [Kiloniellaceae bacterium]